MRLAAPGHRVLTARKRTVPLPAVAQTELIANHEPDRRPP